eukprot:TRINITY_DN4667_c1_g1_i1.p1 TRINITY_DN4667_c1_g1~~TRINITY_DN4667_c1_g1_i1.p1  ORF type:complete len:573 (-),score=128.90 TRINITY_DN4667_c1_g1_i1:45-1763(-)
MYPGSFRAITPAIFNDYGSDEEEPVRDLNHAKWRLSRGKKTVTTLEDALTEDMNLLPNAFAPPTASSDGSIGSAASSSQAASQTFSSWASGEDSAAESEEMSVCALTFVFGAFSLGVQACMSYAGGAVPMSLPKIMEVLPAMSNMEVGMLGALDKLAVILVSMPVGWALQRYDTKCLLSVGLLLNSLFTLQFGFLRNLDAMYLARFMQGCSEAQQIVWGTVWTSARAPKKLLPLWMNLGGLAAGLGTALGTAVAGYTTSYPYSFAFAVQALLLAVLWLLMLFTPSRYLSLPTAQEEEEVTQAGSAVRQRKQPSTRRQVRSLFNNSLYLRSLLCIALINYITSGMQFFWNIFFSSPMWGIDLANVTTSNLVINGIGTGLGIVVGPILVNGCGGYSTDQGRHITLRLLQKFSLIGASGGCVVIFGIVMQLRGNNDGLGGHSPWLWVTWLGTLPLNFALTSQVGVQAVINIGSLPAEMQAFAQGVTTCGQMLLGNAGGVMLPSLVMDTVWYVALWAYDYKISEAHLQAVCFCTVCGAAFPLLLATFFTRRAAADRCRAVHFLAGGEGSEDVSAAE